MLLHPTISAFAVPIVDGSKPQLNAKTELKKCKESFLFFLFQLETENKIFLSIKNFTLVGLEGS